MQKKLLALCLTLCSQQFLFSMDTIEPQSIHPSNKETTTADATKAIALEEMINTIDKAINKKYSTDNDFINFLGTFQFTEKKRFDTINIIEECYGKTLTPNNDLIDKLCAKNSFFSLAIDYFSNLARTNFDNTTCINLNTVIDPTLQQPTSQLNWLSLSIRKYVINRALKEINHEYDIILTGHTKPIHSFDICEATHQAATCSINSRRQRREHDDNTFYLWDLKTGKIIHTFDEKRPIHLLAFNPNGSCIAAALYDENVIKVWCPKTGILQHTFTINDVTESLQYTHPKNHTLMVIESNKTLRQFAVTTHNVTAGESVSHNWIGGRLQTSRFHGIIEYHAMHPMTHAIAPKSALYVTKKNCHSLYLCKQAIKNTGIAQTLKNINSTQPYLSLTTYEQKIVWNLAQEKIALLQTQQQTISS